MSQQLDRQTLAHILQAENIETLSFVELLRLFRAEEVMAQVINSVLTKSNIQALILSRDVNLPPPIPMPKVNMKQDNNDYIG